MQSYCPTTHHFIYPFSWPVIQNDEQNLENLSAREKTIAIVTPIIFSALILGSGGIGIVGVGLAFGVGLISFYGLSGYFKTRHVTVNAEVPNPQTAPSLVKPSSPIATSTTTDDSFEQELSPEVKKYTKEEIYKKLVDRMRDPESSININGETPGFVDGVVTTIRSKYKAIGEQVVQYTAYLLIYEETIICPHRDWLAYRLLNQYYYQLVEEEIKNLSKNNSLNIAMAQIDAPSDGNCFLWSCVIALEVLQNKKPHEMKAQFLQLSSSQNLYNSLRKKQEELRETLTALLIQKIEFDDITFKNRLLDYLFNNDAFSAFTPQDEATQLLIRNSDPAVATRLGSLINEYVVLLTENGSWNGEFEAELVAEIIQRPLIILSLDGAHYKYRTCAGSHISATPLFVLHTGNHYRALIPGF
jgi:hypothetical protein